jgi:hypothetical protein
MGAWVRGVALQIVCPQQLWNVILCQAPVPDTSTQYDAHSARAIGVRKHPTVLRRPTFSPALKLPVISCRELERAARPLPRSPPLYPQHQISLSFSFSGLHFFSTELSSSLSTQPTMTTRLRKWLISSPPAEWALNQIRELLIGALRQGPIPRHVAFVMDGNRRYARSHRIETVEGHNLGFEALARVGFKAEWAINHEADTFVCLDP